MDAVEFLKEKNRMCNTFNLCDGGGYKETCELYKEGLSCADYTNDYPAGGCRNRRAVGERAPPEDSAERVSEDVPERKVSVRWYAEILPAGSRFGLYVPDGREKKLQSSLRRLSEEVLA